MPVPLQSDDRVLLPEWLSEVLGLGQFGVAGEFVAALIAGVTIAGLMLTLSAIAGPWAKRKITATFTDRIAVNRVGPFGLLIIVADAVRLLSKELIVPEDADRPAWDIAPLLVVVPGLFGFAVIPFGSIGGVEVQLADPEVGLVIVFAIASVTSLGIAMAGYASANKYSLIGGLRAVAQNLAYEIPLIIAAAAVVVMAGSLQLSEIVAQQEAALFTVAGISIPAWYGIVNPLAFAVFMAANLAEVARNPFDTPEAPTEIIAGYQTEYSSVYFVLIYLGEFMHIFLGGAIAAVLFMGGGAGPVLPEPVWFVAKIWAVFLFTQWARSALPRVRIDQLIEIGWKGMLVLSFTSLIVTLLATGMF